MAWLSDVDYFARAVEISRNALREGNDPFGALLVDSNGTIIMEQQNGVGELKDPTAHDAFLLASRSSRKYDPDYLWDCTLYATVEPCLMCIGAIFWANIGHVKYAIKESDLNAMFPGDPMITIHSTMINEHLAKDITISGPCEKITPEAKSVIQQWIDTFN